MHILLMYSSQVLYNFYFIVFILYLPASYKINDGSNLCPLLKLVTVGNPSNNCSSKHSFSIMHIISLVYSQTTLNNLLLEF